MPDFDSLRGLGDDTPMAPVSEVRRRGNRLRRRRRALTALGGAAAVAVVAAGTTLLLDGQRGGELPVSPVATEPPGGWLREIPTSFALDRGWPDAEPPETNQQGPSQKFAPFTEQGIRACGVAAYPSSYPVDNLGAVWSGPEDGRQRELTVYADDRTANQVARTLADAWKACPENADIELAQTSLGDGSWRAIVGRHQLHAALQVYHLVRVGNAVLLSQEPSVEIGLLAADMCVFALDPCGTAPEEGPEISSKIPPLDESVLLTTEDLTAAVPGAWREIDNREDPTLDCQADWLNSLNPVKGAFREWQAPAAEASTGVLEFADPGAALDAYDTIRSWLHSCEQRIPAVRPLSLDLEGADKGLGGLAYTRRVTADADAGRKWVDDQGVNLVGNRVLLLSVATLTAGEVPSGPFEAALVAGQRPAYLPPTLGPKGIGTIELGMAAEEVFATGLTRDRTTDNCDLIGLSSVSPDIEALQGVISAKYGLVSLTGGVTPEGIRVGATLDELKRTYPSLREEPSGWYTDVPGEPANTYYFGVEQDGRVSTVALQLKEQDCFN